jgi:hypothetical protein
MSNTRNRGRIIWILASSRPDLIEVDLKRPGRIDVKIPLLPTSSARESFGLLQMLCKRKGIEIDETSFAELEARMPKRLTPGAAETLAVKVYRLCRTQSLVPLDSLRSCLTEYRHPVPREVLDFQIALAVREASDVEFVPTAFRDYASPSLKNSLEGPE